MDKNPVSDLKAFSVAIRSQTLDMVYNAKASHIGGAFSMADILAVLYGRIMKTDPANPSWSDRDRFMLSKGHACTSLYATLALRGFFDTELLSTYTKDNSLFLAHTSHKIPGVEFSAGSLGHALSVGCGLAYAAKLQKATWRVYALLSDGELDEGSNWEAILFAPQHKLDNITLIIDYNKIQSLGTVKEVIDLHPLDDKFTSFGWNVIEIDGHNHDEIVKACETAKILNGKPTVIIAHTIKGKGVDFMEDKLLWHYKSPSEEQYSVAKNQILK